MLLDLIDDKSTLVQVMAGCRKASSNYLSQCWPRFMWHMVSLGHNELTFKYYLLSIFGFHVNFYPYLSELLLSRLPMLLAIYRNQNKHIYLFNFPLFFRKQFFFTFLLLAWRVWNVLWRQPISLDVWNGLFQTYLPLDTIFLSFTFGYLIRYWIMNWIFISRKHIAPLLAITEPVCEIFIFEPWCSAWGLNILDQRWPMIYKGRDFIARNCDRLCVCSYLDVQYSNMIYYTNMIYLVILCLGEIQSISIEGDIICLKTICMISMIVSFSVFNQQRCDGILRLVSFSHSSNLQYCISWCIGQGSCWWPLLLKGVRWITKKYFALDTLVVDNMPYSECTEFV